MRKKKEPEPKRDAFTAMIEATFHTPCVKEHRFHPVRLWRFDYALPAYMVAIEVEGGVWMGGRHTHPKGFTRDMEKYNTAEQMGWHILRFTPRQVAAGACVKSIGEIIEWHKRYVSTDAQRGV